MLPGDAPPHVLAMAHAPLLPVADRPRKPRPTGGPEGPWWRRPWERA